jgi:hypothetical protein
MHYRRPQIGLFNKTIFMNKNLHWEALIDLDSFVNTNKQIYSLLIFSIRLILVIAFFNCETTIRAFTHFTLFLIAFGSHPRMLFTTVVNFVLFQGFIENVWVNDLRRVTTIFRFILKWTFGFEKFTD